MQFNIPAEHKNASGVYIIRNSVNAKVYVGSAKSFLRRYHEHTSKLNRQVHSSRSLQNFVGKYGCESLSFHLLEVTVTDKSALLACEQKWLDYYQCYKKHLGFNTCTLATSTLGVKQTPEAIAKMALAKKGTSHSSETKQKMSEAQKGRKASPETLIRLRDAQLNPSPEAIANRAAAAAARKGSSHTAETRQKMSEAAKRRAPRGPRSAETTAKMVASRRANPENWGKQKGRVFSDSHRQRISEALKGRRTSVRSPEGELRRITGVKAAAERKRQLKALL